ncbi:MAG TPA: hypothetical protein PKL08_09450 [Thermoanaerobaculaceae bacterium]|nr:hypothetical protein [Thermoanaerobaculaceae bacterium]
MIRVCQALIVSFSFPVLASPASIGLLATPPAAVSTPILVEKWAQQPFPDFVLAAPEMAAAQLLAAGGMGELKPLPPDFDTATLGATLAARLSGLLPQTLDGTLSISVAAADRKGVLAAVHGSSLLLVVPADGSADRENIISSAAEAFVAASLSASPPSSTLGEPLLALGEALAHGGALALASLPPGLRPVSGWLEPTPARSTLGTFAREMLDAKTPWSARQARLAITGRPGGANPALAQAAAAVLECLGTPGYLATRPEDFLAAWSKDESKDCPAMPRELRRALSDPQHAGQPPADQRTEVESVAASARERAVEVGPLDPLPTGELSAAQRLLLAARLRASASPGLCSWLAGSALPPSALTGCREDEPRAGFLLARPRPGRGFEVVWHGSAGLEHPVLIWPRWVLSPVLWQQGGFLAFIDPQGIWTVPLQGQTAPTLVAAGGFRHLAPSPDGALLAAARWPEPETWLLAVRGDPVRLGSSGKAGVAWLENEVLVAASGEFLGLFSRQGEGRAQALKAPCTTAMSTLAGKLYLAEGTPCENAVWRLDPTTGQRERLLSPPEPVAALHASTNGMLLMATSSGLWRWQAGGTPERFSDGLTIGP